MNAADLVARSNRPTDFADRLGHMLDYTLAAIDRRDARIVELQATVQRLEEQADNYFEANRRMHADRAHALRDLTATTRERDEAERLLAEATS